MSSKNIILLSGMDTSDNIDALRYIKEKHPKFKKICYIPAQAQGSEGEIKQALKDFKGYVKATCFKTAVLEHESSNEIKKKIKTSDIVFLGGGNTFYFFDNIKKKRLFLSLKRHLQNKKMIIGLSAGGIVLSPSLMMACFPSKDADECNVERKDFKALSFLPFEICPHYKNSKNMTKDLLAYSSLYNFPLYGIKDGNFIAIGDEGVYFSNKIDLFFHGEKVEFR